MSVVIAAGGTGGHFYPGLAVARELLASRIQVSFLIKKGDFVRPLLEREKIPFTAISAGGFKRSLHPANIIVVAKLVVGFFEAVQFFFNNRPTVLMVMGGYLSVPPALAARLFGIPVVLHEQNVTPGLANRLLRFVAKKVAVSFPDSLASFGQKGLLTGNPVRKEFGAPIAPTDARKKWGLDPNKLTFLIFGGSLGAHRLNELVVEAFSGLGAHADRFQVIHITGPSDVTWVRERYAKTRFKAYIDSYCHDMPAAYAASDLVISRSGASTISEICVMKKPALLIPYPHSTGGHQKANAQVLAKIGVAHIHEQEDLEGGHLKNVLDLSMKNPTMWQSWGENYAKLSINPLEAAKKIAELIRTEGAA